MNPEELRLECLRLAASGTAAATAGDLVAVAGGFYDFVTGKDRASTVEAVKAAVDALR